MGGSLHFWALRRWLLVPLAATLIIVRLPAADDRAVFSKPEPKHVMPAAPETRNTDNLNLQLRPDRLDPNAPFAIPPSAPPTRLNLQKLQQLLDRRRNWIFVTPEMEPSPFANSLEAAESAFESSLDRPKSVVERYLIQSNPNAGQSSSNTNSSQESKTNSAAQSNSNAGDPNPSAKSDPNANASYVIRTEPFAEPVYSRASDTNSLGAAGPRSALGDLSLANKRLWDSPIDRSPLEFAQPDDRIRQLLRPSSSFSGAAGARDPINLLRDSTRDELQPVTSPRLNDLANTYGSTARNLLGTPQTPAAPDSTRIPLDDPNVKFLGKSSLSPAILTPQPAFVQPMPSVLEMPRRVF